MYSGVPQEDLASDATSSLLNPKSHSLSDGGPPLGGKCSSRLSSCKESALPRSARPVNLSYQKVLPILNTYY